MTEYRHTIGSTYNFKTHFEWENRSFRRPQPRFRIIKSENDLTKNNRGRIKPFVMFFIDDNPSPVPQKKRSKIIRFFKRIMRKIKRRHYSGY